MIVPSKSKIIVVSCHLPFPYYRKKGLSRKRFFLKHSTNRLIFWFLKIVLTFICKRAIFPLVERPLQNGKKDSFTAIDNSGSRTRTYDIMINSHALLPTELCRNETAWRRPTLTKGNPSLQSALRSLTSVFGMVTGVSFSLSPPHYSIE